MAQSAFFSNTNGTGKNISSETTLDTFIASCDVLLKIDGRLSNLNGAAASLVVIARHTDSSGSITIREFYFAESKRIATDTVYGFSFTPFLLKNGEKVSVRVKSTNASDTNITWSLDWVNDRSVDVYDWMGTATVTPTVSGVPTVETPSVPTVTEIASAIFTNLLASGDFETSGSFGKLVKDNLDTPVSGAGSGLTPQQVRDALKLAASAGSPADGSIDAMLATLLQRTAEGVEVLVGNHIAADGETLTIVQGQTYTAALSNAITINVTDTRLSDAITSDGTIPVLTISNAGRSVTVEGEVAAFDDDDSTATCTFELTRAQTADIPAGSTGTWELDFKMAGDADDVLTSVIDSPAVIKRQVSE